MIHFNASLIYYRCSFYVHCRNLIFFRFCSWQLNFFVFFCLFFYLVKKRLEQWFSLFSHTTPNNFIFSQPWITKKAEISIKNTTNPILLQSINFIKQINHTTLSKKLNVLALCTVVNLVALGTVFALLKYQIVFCGKFS